MHQRCEVQYRFRYEEGIPGGAGIHGIRGSGFHAGTAHNFRQKIKTRRDLPLREVLDVAAESIDLAFKGEVYLTEEERSIGIAPLRGKVKDLAVAMTRHHHLRVAPFVQPALVEETIKVTPHKAVLPRPLVGRIDLVTTEDDLLDDKTVWREPQEGQEHVDQQLTMYAMLFQAKTGRLPRNVGFDYVYGSNRHSLHHVRRLSKRDHVDLKAMVETLQTVEASIKTGIFRPTDPTSWACSEKWCSYWHICPFVRGGRRRT